MHVNFWSSKAALQLNYLYKRTIIPVSLKYLSKACYLQPNLC